MADFYFPDLFKMEVSILELILRGSILYLGLLFLMRIMPRRTGGELTNVDLIFIVLIAHAAGHSLGEYTSISEGFIVIITLILWNYMVNWLSFRVPLIEKLFSAPPIKIIRSGKMLKRNMRREFITEEELKESLHKKGIDSILQVKAAYVESDGSITFIENKK